MVIIFLGSVIWIDGFVNLDILSVCELVCWSFRHHHLACKCRTILEIWPLRHWQIFDKFWDPGDLCIFSCPEQLNRWLTHSVTFDFDITEWPLRHLIRVMRRHDLTKKSTYPHTYLPTYLSTYLREHPQGAILETCDLYDIWSECWGDLTWPKKRPTYYLRF